MAVTINEFEVVPEAAPATRSVNQNNNATQQDDEPITLEELDELMQRELERSARLWAH